MDIFLDSDDRELFLGGLRRWTRQTETQVWAWCLMGNHFHLLLVPTTVDGLAKTLHGVTFGYAQHFNQKHGRCGRLWQNRYYSAPLDAQTHLWTVARYIERNPVRASIVLQAEDWRWSSARAHISGKDPLGLLELKQWQEILSPSEWKAFLSRNEESGKITALRSHTRRGRPLGNDAFLSKIEISLGKRLRPLPVGRPGKSSSKTSQSSVRPS